MKVQDVAQVISIVVIPFILAIIPTFRILHRDQLYPGRCIGATLQFHTKKSLITPGAGDISWCKHTVCASVIQARDSSALD